jgi:amino acid transporter
MRGTSPRMTRPAELSDKSADLRPELEPESPQILRREIGWHDAFWLASGVPALVLFSIGGIAATVGTPSYIVWPLSVLLGFIQSFTYAEIAGMFPSKSGGASIYGAAAWIRYGKLFAPLSVWCNWLAWTPVLAIGCGIAAGYILNGVGPTGSALRGFELILLDLSALKSGLKLRIDATFIVGAVLLLMVFAIQNRGVWLTARFQMTIGALALLPLLIIALVPIVAGKVKVENLVPLAPLRAIENGHAVLGSWDRAGWGLFLGGLFLAAWSTYALETTICYTSELKDPGRDCIRSIFAAGLLCLLMFTIVPFAFQGTLGLEAMLDPSIFDGSGVPAAMARMVGGGAAVSFLIVVLLLLALVLSIITAMAGSSRTLYQGAVDGWLPRYLARVNAHGAPTRAMWTGLVFNVVVLLLSDYVFVLAVSNCCYLIFNFLNLNAGWIHRIDNPQAQRPWRAPDVLIGLGTAFAFFNAFLLGAGANIYGSGTLITGLLAAAIALPIFAWRHYVTDHGIFPAHMLADLHIRDLAYAPRRAGSKPYLAFAGGVAAVIAGKLVFG